MRAVVTGATGGIGEAIARRLADDGLTVTLVGRTDEDLDAARDRIGTAVPGASLALQRADFAELSQVRDLARRLLDEPLPEVVVSVAAPPDAMSPGGEQALTAGHLAPYLLLRTLAAPLDRARFVLAITDPVAEEMNVMFGCALARRLAGTGITVNGALPPTGPEPGARRPRVPGDPERLPCPDMGADTPAWLAVSPDVKDVTGWFFRDRVPVETPPDTMDVARCNRLWQQSARRTGLPV
jgi:NAD(P)-dependent dehydrogenase (short-subunit alcohol dehydrogenase family)